MISRRGKVCIAVISIIPLLMSCLNHISITREDFFSVGFHHNVYVISPAPNVPHDEDTRYGNVIVEDFDNAEGIDLSNTSAGVDTSRGVVFLGGTEHFPGKLIFTAMDNAHNGNMGGISGADQLVNQNAAQQGFGASRWKAFLSSSQQNVRDIVPEPYASTMPIVDRNEDLLFNNWNDIFDGSSRWQANHYLRTFVNRDVNENTGANPDWRDADGWHGSDTQGRFVNGETCNDWTSTNHGGRATELDGYNVLGQEGGGGHPGSQTLAVMAVELPGSMFSGDKTLGHIHSNLFHNEWTTIGAARMTWYENTPPGTSIVYNMTVDDEHWETMVNNTNRVFEFQGSKLRWNATMRTNNPDISPAIYRIIIEYDLVSPPEPTAPNSEAWQGTPTPTLEWNFTDPDNGDHQSDYNIEIYSDTEMNSMVYNTSWINSTETKHIVGKELDDGTYYWRVRTKDIYHAPSNFSALKRLMIDVTKPVGNITIEGGAFSVNEQLVTLEINASDNGSGIAEMQIIGDNGNQGPWEEYKNEKRIALSKDDGLKKIEIRFKDHAGIISELYNDTVYYDLKGPLEILVTSVSHPDPLWYYNSTRPTFQWEPPLEITGIKGYSYMVDSSRLTEPGKILYKSNSEITQTVPGEFTGFKDGEWHFHITSCDTYDQWGNTTHFQFNIDTTSPEITDVSPGNDKWHDVTEIQASAVFQDMDGFGLDLDSIMYSLKLEGGSFSKWTDEGLNVDILQSGIQDNAVKARASVDIAVKEGSENAIRWQVNDLAGNGPVRSEIIHIKVDQTPVTFSEPVPGEEEISLETEVSCGITITDAGSGVDGKTIEYSVSSWGPDEEHFLNWTLVNSNMIKDTIEVLLDIEFEAGRNNYIRWRAMDVIGNDFALSAPSQVWVNSPPIPVIERPTEGSVVEEGAEIALSARGSFDNEGDELTYYWEIKNRSSKMLVFSGHGIEENATLNDAGKFIVTLFVDDGFGFNETSKVYVDIIPKKHEPDNDTGGGESSGQGKEKSGMVQEWGWLFAIIALVIIIIVVIGLIVAGKRRKRREETVETAQRPPGVGQPYSMGGPDSYRPGYSEMRPPGGGGHYAQYPNKGGDPWGRGVPTPVQHSFSPRQQMMTQRPSVPAYPGTQYGSRSQQITIPAPESPYSASSREGFTQLPAPTSTDPKYSLPSFTTDSGSQDLNLMALPPANEEDSGSDPNMLSPNPPTDAPSTGEPPIPNLPKIHGSSPSDAPSAGEPPIPDLPKIPGSQPPNISESPFMGPDVSPPDILEPSFREPDASSPDIHSGEQLPRDPAVPNIRKETPSRGIQNDFLDEIFGGSSTSKDKQAQIENTTPEPPAAPSHDPPTPHFRTFQCHQCNTMNPVTSGIRPTVVTCAACGAKGYLEK